MSEGVFEALLANLTREADALGFTCGATFFREEGFGVSLRTE
jgi:hypothetical protein